MSHEFARARRSMASLARSFWTKGTPRPAEKSHLRFENLETRDVPTVNVTSPTVSSAGVLTLTNVTTATAAETLTLTQGAAGSDQLTVANAAASTKTFTGVKILQIINQDIVPANNLDVIVGAAGTGDLSSASLPSLRQIAYQSNLGSQEMVMGGVTNPNLYTVFNGNGILSQIIVPKAGVVVANVTAPTATGSSVQLNTTNATANTSIALDFRSLANAAVQVNLNLSSTGAAAAIATSTNLQVQLVGGTAATPATATRVIGVYGSKGNNVIIGNDSGDMLIGGGGNSTLIGGNGNNQIDAVRDFSPALAGTATNGVSAYNPFTATTPVDLAQFGNVSAAIKAIDLASGVGGSTSAALYNAFGLFNFGEGAAALSGASGVSNTSLAADFTTANNQTSPVVSVQEFAGTGNNGFYGFNGAAVTATGRGGSDVFSSNTGGLPSEYNAGDFAGNSSLLIGSVGSTLVAGAGTDNFSFAVTNTSAAQALTSHVITGTGNSTIQAGFQNVDIDAGTGKNKVAIANFASNALIFNAQTENLDGSAFNPANVPLVHLTNKG